jgi:hypothetical protein
MGAVAQKSERNAEKYYQNATNFFDPHILFLKHFP